MDDGEGLRGPVSAEGGLHDLGFRWLRDLTNDKSRRHAGQAAGVVSRSSLRKRMIIMPLLSRMDQLRVKSAALVQPFQAGIEDLLAGGIEEVEVRFETGQEL